MLQNKQLGTLYISNVRKMNSFDNIEYKFVVARKYPYKSLEELRRNGWEWLYYLAPNKYLFDETKRAKKDGELSKEMFNNYYAVEYKTQLLEDKSREQLDVIFNLLASSKDVVIVCWCNDFSQCHTSILAETFKSVGIKVQHIY